MRDEILKLHQSDFGTAEETEVIAALRSGWLTKGPRTRQFEEDFARRVGAEHALGTNSCTAALHLALLAGGIGPGDEVIVPALTFAASANVVVHCGAQPVFADVLPGTHNIDPAHAERLITPATRAIVPVHFAGIPAELEAIHALADKHSLFVVEDCAHAVESEYRGQPVGVASGSRFAAYSFYATKNLITGEGGMLTCRDADDLERARVLGLHGMSANAWQRYAQAGGTGFRLYDIVAAGYKYNMFDLQAALGLVQLAKLDENWQARQDCAEHYDRLLEAVSGVAPLEVPAHVNTARHLYVVRLDAELLEGQPDGETPHASPVRDGVIIRLRERKVEAYLHFICLPETEYYSTTYGTSAADTPVAAELSRRSITLPLFPGMQRADVEYVVETLKAALP
jgi:dTDP-4-amino-4,6-dideoxygalactose transaminase